MEILLQKYWAMKDQSQISTSLQLKTQPNLPPQNFLDLVVEYYKSALRSAQSIISAYGQELEALRQQNNSLRTKNRHLEESIKEFKLSLERQFEKQRKEKKLQEQIHKLNHKLTVSQKTIEILEDKLLILNVSINKQLYQQKIGQPPRVPNSYNSVHQTEKKGLSEKKSKLKYGILEKSFTKDSTAASNKINSDRHLKLTDLRLKNFDYRKKRAQTEESGTAAEALTPRSFVFL